MARYLLMYWCGLITYIKGQKMNRFKRYTMPQVLFALSDCHETLQIGEYSYESEYARKLWSEIDCLRARLQELNNGKGV